MPTIGTPNDLDILIHAYCTPEPHPRASAPAVKQGFNRLKAHEMVYADNEGVWRTTDKGEFYLTHLLKVPFPVQKWEIPDGHLDGE